ncbi:M23 family metallopeptidase [Solirubrobacter ginsenosidimutans]|uniref:M23 family metallopeptidase n=1 Tax=Solirubrobacter ginsenosidimutans TaxID=490573 RepID=A0A9X3MZ52_9ACTN|nr:M23 family metallopeptidase [Solirubrobacter ginsenosidimutans]MDA0165439.1 M23 family metallopeptidase [Solirubrobacter ginsenosidimutans]
MASPLPSSPATVAKLACASSCGAAGMVRPGSLLRVRGKTLSKADEVVFMGAAGVDDDVIASTSVRRKTSVDVRVPLGAIPGPVAVVDSNGAVSVPSVGPVVLDPAAPAVAGPSVEIAVRAPRAYYDAATPAAATYVVHGGAPVTVGVDVVRVLDGAVITHWDVPGVAPETPQRVAWDGTVAKVLQADGKYAFRITVAGLAPVSAPFEFFSDRFPILGPSRFGTGVAAFGGGRGHQGEDTFAACGTPLVAAHGGKVKYAGYHVAAGNYLVIDNEGVGTDYVYMHLRDVALVKTGDRVLTGQPIGFVGQTGHADGCHLHFELWTAPGWYSGGAPIDPLPTLRSWLSRG